MTRYQHYFPIICILIVLFQWFFDSGICGDILEYPVCSQLCGASINDTCTEDQNPDCGFFDASWSSCVYCDIGYFSMGPEYKCASCQETGGCSDCADYKGCVTCDSGTLEWSADCGFKFCQGSTDTDHDISTAPDVTETTSTVTVTETNTDVDDTETTDTPETTNRREESEEIADTDSDIVVVSISTTSAIALFDNNGIYGSVQVTNGHVIVNLNFSDFELGELPDDCFKHGLYYGLYDDWGYSSNADRLGSEECSKDDTGLRWDPWLACSTSTSNDYCSNYDNSGDGCIPAGTWKDVNDDNEYVCSEVNYARNAFACEMGDWSGKYGKLYIDSNTKSMVNSGGSSSFEVDSYDLTGKSVVFRCGLDKSRAFCAPFQDYTSSTDDTDTHSYNRAYQNHTFSKIAYINDNSFVKLTYYNRYEVDIDVSTLAIPGSCGDSIFYRIFTDSISDNSNCNMDNVGDFYDPTMTCDEDSEQIENGYCDDSQLCFDSSFTYECEVNGYYNNNLNRHLCGPGDLSNKYGSIDISVNSNYRYNVTGYDPLMIPLSLLDGKSIVVQCENDYEIIGCGQFEDYKLDAGLGNTFVDGYTNADTTSDDKNIEKNENSESENKFLGVSNEVALVMIILLLLTIIPCVCAACKRNRKNDETMNVIVSSTYKNKQRIRNQRNHNNNNNNNNSTDNVAHMRSPSRSQSRTQSHSGGVVIKFGTPVADATSTHKPQVSGGMSYTREHSQSGSRSHSRTRGMAQEPRGSHGKSPIPHEYSKSHQLANAFDISDARSKSAGPGRGSRKNMSIQQHQHVHTPTPSGNKLYINYDDYGYDDVVDSKLDNKTNYV